MKKITKNAINGWINLYKPKGMSSAQAVGAVKRLLRPQKIGHAGTLDPLAEGVLPLALGEATKTVPYMMNAVKGYEFSIVWGEARSTDDAEGEVIETCEVIPSQAEIESILPQFTGRIQQIPPAYSAIKVNGKRAYDLARKGLDVELKAREIEIYTLELDSCFRGNDRVPTAKSQRKLPAQCIAAEGSEHFTDITVVCSKGTYIRSLARDIAHALGTCGYVGMLRRVRTGKFNAEDAISLDFLEESVHKASNISACAGCNWLLPASAALDDIPALHVDAMQAKALQNGQFLAEITIEDSPEIAVYCKGSLVAIVSADAGRVRPKRVFNL